MLLNTIYGKYKIVSIVGMAKNSGKTVALNHLINEAYDEDIKLGIVSTGRDGESIDLVTETEKPKIFVEEGTIISTTTNLLPLSDVNVEIMKITSYRTPLGEILLGRAKNSGYIQIAGPQTAAGIKEISNLLLSLGAEMVIVDGAMDRKTSAAPSVSEATILSTGAVLSRNMNKVIEETVHTVSLFNLPPVSNPMDRQIIEKTIDRGEVAIIDNELNVNSLNVKTALNSGRIIGQNIKDNSKYVVISGSLIENTVEELIMSTNKYKKIQIVVSDGTKIFISPKEWIRFLRYGINVKVLNPINLVAVTLNPYSPDGYYFNPREFLDKMRYFIKDLPVVDLVLGGEDLEIYG